MNLRVYTAILFTVTLFSCSNDFDLTTDYKEHTVVYGLLDPNDSTQYIKINRSFLDEETNALVLAQQSDQLYHENIGVFIEETTESGSLIEYPALSRVDANAILGQKPSGTFANSPNYLYAFNNPINETSSYKLRILGSETGEEVSAIASIVESFTVTYPRKGIAVSWLSEKVTTRWKSAKNALRYDLIIRFRYKEIIGSDTTEKYLDWKAMRNLKSNDSDGGASLEFDIPGSSFFNYVAHNIEKNSNVTKRILQPYQFIFYAGGIELSNVIEVQNAQSGLTEGQIQPEYTNVENGLGIFSSRSYVAVDSVLYNTQTTDSLISGPITGHLKFSKN